MLWSRQPRVLLAATYCYSGATGCQFCLQSCVTPTEYMMFISTFKQISFELGFGSEPLWCLFTVPLKER